MSSIKLNKIGGFLRRWINSVIFVGYNINDVLCFYIVRSGQIREVPHSWELIQDKGCRQAWQDMKEFLLPYDAVRQSPSPENALMDFCQSTYEAAANLAKWDRKALERS